jgi:hypothetical protein
VFTNFYQNRPVVELLCQNMLHQKIEL